MTVTNKLGLPQALVDAVSTKKHNEDGTVSATTLKSGVREILLTKRHWDEIEVDAADEIWKVFGTAVHNLLDKDSPDCIHEEKFKFKVSETLVCGTLDCFDTKREIIFDYKTASTWKCIFQDFDDWHFQGMVYAWLLSKAGMNVKECRFIMLLKDHSKTKARQDASYPQSPCCVYQFYVNDNDLREIEEIIKEKVSELERCEELPDEELPLCSEKERWAKPSTYAVLKKGRKTALKVCSTKEEAQQYLNEKGGDLIEYRKGSDGKCEGYCTCHKFCQYWKDNYETIEDFHQE